MSAALENAPIPLGEEGRRSTQGPLDPDEASEELSQHAWIGPKKAKRLSPWIIWRHRLYHLFCCPARR